jgi:hypothetical protein
MIGEQKFENEISGYFGLHAKKGVPVSQTNYYKYKIADSYCY